MYFLTTVFAFLNKLIETGVSLDTIMGVSPQYLGQGTDRKHTVLKCVCYQSDGAWAAPDC